MAAFNVTAADSMQIVDKFNKVGNEFSVSSSNIGEGLLRSASALAEGGNSLDESIGLIVGAYETTRDITKVGTALKTLSLRLRGMKTELDDDGLDSDGVTTTSTMRDKLLGLTGGKVDIMIDENTLKSTTQIIREMAAAYNEMTDTQAQAMESAMYRAKQYREAIEELEATREQYSDEEYTEKLNELTEGQWECIDAYEAAKDAILDLNSTRIDAVKDGIQKEIDAYTELIELAKEELNAKKQLHDFEKSISDQTQTISDLERQIAARAGSTDAATIAERKELEAQLLDAKAALNDSYFDNAITAQEQALDDELEAYNKAKDAELEALELMLENIEVLVADSFEVIRANADVVMGQLTDISDQYGINLSTALTEPWTEGSYAIDSYTGYFLDAGSAFTNELDRIKGKWKELQEQASATAEAMLTAVDAEVDSVTTHSVTSKDTETKEFTETPSDSNADTNSGVWMDWDPSLPENNPNYTSTSEQPTTSAIPAVNDLVTVKSTATKWSRDGGKGYTMHDWVPGSQFYVRRVEGDEVLIAPSKSGAHTGWVKIKDLEGYAKGTNKVPDDEWAWIDEIGEEIVLNAGDNGRLQYLTKGSSVIPADISENLMALGRLDPTEVLKRSMPDTAPAAIVAEPISMDLSFGSLVHVDTVTEDTLPKLKNMIQTEFDILMRGVNQGLKKYVR